MDIITKYQETEKARRRSKQNGELFLKRMSQKQEETTTENASIPLNGGSEQDSSLPREANELTVGFESIAEEDEDTEESEDELLNEVREKNTSTPTSMRQKVWNSIQTSLYYPYQSRFLKRGSQTSTKSKFLFPRNDEFTPQIKHVSERNLKPNNSRYSTISRSLDLCDEQIQKTKQKKNEYFSKHPNIQSMLNNIVVPPSQKEDATEPEVKNDTAFVTVERQPQEDQEEEEDSLLCSDHETEEPPPPIYSNYTPVQIYIPKRINSLCQHENNNCYMYILKSVICHTGTLSYGHYYCYVQYDNDLWARISDDQVKLVSSDEVKSVNPYII